MTEREGLAVEVRGRVAVATIAGDVDTSNVEAVRERIVDGVPNELAGLVVDLTAVSYLDSAGVGLLFELAGQLTRAGQHMRIVIPPTSLVLRVLELTGVNAAVPFADTVEAGVAEIDAAAPSP